MSIKLNDLIHALDSHELVSGNLDCEATGLEYSSKEIEPGSVFVATPGMKVDGFDFAAEAVERGAVAVVSERDNEQDLPVIWVRTPDCRKGLSDLAAKYYNYPGKRLKVCGITGTNGKTTSAFMLKQLLEARGKRVGLISSLVYDTAGDLFTAERTTPESLDVQRLLYLMHANECNNVVMEVSSHALSLHRVENIEFRVGLFTNITRDHLDFHGDMKSYFEAKASLLDKLDGLTKYSVINLDVPEFRDLFGRIKSAYLSFSLEDKAADIHTTAYEFLPDRTIFDLVTPMGMSTISMPLCGKFNLINAIGAVGAALASGVDIDTAASTLEQMRSVPGRFQRVDCGQPFVVIIDYAHTPDAIERAIESAQPLKGEIGRVLTLFGCGGDRDSGKRPLMGQAASRSDLVFVTSDNPRTEDPKKIIEDIKPGLSGSYSIESDRKTALGSILAEAREGDVVLLLGKGAEPYEINATGKHPYSEQEETQRALSALGFHAAAAPETT